MSPSWVRLSSSQNRIKGVQFLQVHFLVGYEPSFDEMVLMKDRTVISSRSFCQEARPHKLEGTICTGKLDENGEMFPSTDIGDSGKEYSS